MESNEANDDDSDFYLTPSWRIPFALEQARRAANPNPHYENWNGPSGNENGSVSQENTPNYENWNGTHEGEPDNDNSNGPHEHEPDYENWTRSLEYNHSRQTSIESMSVSYLVDSPHPSRDQNLSEDATIPSTPRVQMPRRLQQTNPRVVQQPQDEDGYTLATPHACPTYQHGVRITTNESNKSEAGFFTRNWAKIIGSTVVIGIVVGSIGVGLCFLPGTIFLSYLLG